MASTPHTHNNILTEEQKRQYEEDGFIVVKEVFSKEDVQEMQNAVRYFINESAKLTESNEVYDFEAGHTTDNPLLRRVYCPSHHHPTFDKVLKYPKLLDIISELIGPSFRYMPQDKLNIKLAKIGSAAKWHQDWAFYPHTNDSLVSVCVAIDDATEENGCLKIVPGSHKGPLLSHFEGEDFISSITDPALEPEKAVPIEIPSGGVSIHHVRAVHGSGANRSDRSRPLIVLVYGAMDAWPLLGVAGSDFRNVGPVDFDLFNSTMVRGEPCKFPRLEKVPVCLPVPLFSDVTRSIYFSTVEHQDLQM